MHSMEGCSGICNRGVNRLRGGTRSRSNRLHFTTYKSHFRKSKARLQSLCGDFCRFTSAGTEAHTPCWTPTFLNRTNCIVSGRSNTTSTSGRVSPDPATTSTTTTNIFTPEHVSRESPVFVASSLTLRRWQDPSRHYYNCYSNTKKGAFQCYYKCCTNVQGGSSHLDCSCCRKTKEGAAAVPKHTPLCAVAWAPATLSTRQWTPWLQHEQHSTICELRRGFASNSSSRAAAAGGEGGSSSRSRSSVGQLLGSSEHSLVDVPVPPKPRKYFDLKTFRRFLLRYKQREEEAEEVLIRRTYTKPLPDGWTLLTFLNRIGITENIETILEAFPTWVDLANASVEALRTTEGITNQQRRLILKHVRLYNHGLWPENTYEDYIDRFQAEPLANEGKPWSHADDMKLLELANKYDVNFGDPWLYISWEMQREFDDVQTRYTELVTIPRSLLLWLVILLVSVGSTYRDVSVPELAAAAIYIVCYSFLYSLLHGRVRTIHLAGGVPAAAPRLLLSSASPFKRQLASFLQTGGFEHPWASSDSRVQRGGFHCDLLLGTISGLSELRGA